MDLTPEEQAKLDLFKAYCRKRFSLPMAFDEERIRSSFARWARRINLGTSENPAHPYLIICHDPVELSVISRFLREIGPSTLPLHTYPIKRLAAVISGKHPREPMLRYSEGSHPDQDRLDLLILLQRLLDDPRDRAWLRLMTEQEARQYADDMARMDNREDEQSYATIRSIYAAAIQIARIACDPVMPAIALHEHGGEAMEPPPGVSLEAAATARRFASLFYEIHAGPHLDSPHFYSEPYRPQLPSVVPNGESDASYSARQVVRYMRREMDAASQTVYDANRTPSSMPPHLVGRFLRQYADGCRGSLQTFMRQLAESSIVGRGGTRVHTSSNFTAIVKRFLCSQNTPHERDFRRFQRAAPLICFFGRVIVVTKPPQEVHADEAGALHNEHGPAVVQGSGLKMWYLGGIEVDEQTVMSPETLTIEQILATADNDRQMIQIERFGWDRFLREPHAKVIDSRRNDIDGTSEVLARVTLEHRPSQTRFLGICPTGRIVCLSVPDNITTCEEAQAWLAGDADDYTTIAAT